MAPSAYDKNLNITLTLSPDVPVHLIGDPVKIRQVLANLVSNAIKFTHVGSIIIRVDAIHIDENIVTIKFSVKDTGIAIRQENEKIIVVGQGLMNRLITNKLNKQGWHA